MVSMAGMDRVVVAGAQAAVPTEAEAPVRPVQGAALPQAAGAEAIARSMVVARRARSSTYG